jgi:hypothetical protein
MTKQIKQDEGLAHRLAFAKAGEMWRKATDAEKKPFEEKHQADVRRYQEQLQALKKKKFFMIDGVKSTDLED